MVKFSYGCMAASWLCFGVAVMTQDVGGAIFAVMFMIMAWIPIFFGLHRAP